MARDVFSVYLREGRGRSRAHRQRPGVDDRAPGDDPIEEALAAALA
jgi:hypothetical protein